MKKTILVSCLVLNGSRSGYRTIFKNLLIYIDDNRKYISKKYNFIFVFQKSGFDSLEAYLKSEVNYEWGRIILLRNIKSKWFRGIFEQFYIPFMAMIASADYIFMPATFGLLFNLKPVITFVHTNTNFVVTKNLRGRNLLQQLAHAVLIYVTASRSKKILFTTNQTKHEYEKYLQKKVNGKIIGNGLYQTKQIVSLDSISKKLKENNFILSVSQIYRLKNWSNLIKAFILFKEINPNNKTFLVLVGTIQETDYFREIKEISKDRKDICIFHNLTDPAINTLYRLCRGYCLFSFFEGYSLTPGEAVLYNKQIALSDIPTHREIYKQLPFYANPYQIKSIKDSIELLVSNRKHSKKRNKLVQKTISKLSFHKFFKRMIKNFD
jgi:glycosyltransferase involved in cell wall biosynthesis